MTEVQVVGLASDVFPGSRAAKGSNRPSKMGYWFCKQQLNQLHPQHLPQSSILVSRILSVLCEALCTHSASSTLVCSELNVVTKDL